MKYSFEQHIHNYAVWTAARASQRGLTSTRKIREAIESSGLRRFAESANGLKRSSFSESNFNRFHKQTANQLIRNLHKAGIRSASYGRAAKIIAIYLKTSVILRSKNKYILGLIHPPIDADVLKSLSRHNISKGLNSIKWTKMNEVQYWDLYKEVKAKTGSFDWSLEKYWNPERD